MASPPRMVAVLLLSSYCQERPCHLKLVANGCALSCGLISLSSVLKGCLASLAVVLLSFTAVFSVAVTGTSLAFFCFFTLSLDCFCTITLGEFTAASTFSGIAANKQNKARLNKIIPKDGAFFQSTTLSLLFIFGLPIYTNSIL